ncbi:MAG: hypothetical protein RLZZ488_789 [Pseudomonadota bacterium]|jgi:hypothetical protein
MNTEQSITPKFYSLLLAALLAATLGCKTAWWSDKNSSTNEDSSINGSDWNDQSNRTALLSLSPEDYEVLGSRGAPIRWQPLLMPLRTGYHLTDRHFALGVSGTLGTTDGRIPELGQCRMLTQASTISPSKGENGQTLQNVEVGLEDPKGQRTTGNGGQLFLIHDQVSRFVAALGFWDDDGRANCQLPAGRWFISSGFGEARTHKSFIVAPNRENKISLRTHSRARLIIRPGKDTGLQYGDLMRIGRVRAQMPAAQTDEELPEVPLLLQDDLMRSVLAPSENSGVREYLFTSLLLQRPEFSLTVEPGEYAIGLWRDGMIHPCVSRLLVESSDAAVLACDPNAGPPSSSPTEGTGLVQTQKGVELQTLTVSFDGSFMPSRLLGQSSFRAWMAKNGVTRFLRAGRPLDSQNQQFQFSLQPLLQVLSTGGVLQPEGPFIGDFRLTQKSETDAKMGTSSFARLLYAQSGINVDSMLSRVFKIAFANSIPMAGVSERGLLEGAVPLTFRTFLRNAAGRSLRTEETEAFASNGAQIEWIEPSPAASGTPVRLGPQQRVRVRLSIPPEDTTEFFTMFINGESYKQWPVPLSQYRNMIRSLEVDEKISMNKDFYIGFASWGKNYLPEYMFGVRQLPALAFTRLYCIDVNENAVCDRQ